MPDLDLHADAEDWPDNRDEDECEACGGPRVVFIPVGEKGNGILTVEEIWDCIQQARAEVIVSAEQDLESLELLPRGMPDDVVMHIEGYRDGSFFVIIRTGGGDYRQSNARYGQGSVYRGVRAWRHGLAASGGTEEITTDEDRDNSLLVYRGFPGHLRFQALDAYKPSEEVRERLRAAEAIRDRRRPTTSWERHKAAVARRAAEAAAELNRGGQE